MLRKEDNDLLTQVGPRSAMGRFMRRYWVPVVSSDELPAGGRVKRVRILGENLVAFRNGDGQPGLMHEFCPHRRASLYYGRNEDTGLRCVYHGWAFDRQGRCVEMPNEPPGQDFCHKVRHVAYPCRDWGDVVFAYMGEDAAQAPPLPEFEWTLVPAERRFVSKRIQYCNYLQALENGAADSSHVSFLHAPLARGEAALAQDDKSHVGLREVAASTDNSPRFEVNQTDYGLVIGARRNAGERGHYWRIGQFILPYWNMPPVDLEGDPIFHSHAWVPVDDEHCVNWSFSWHPKRPLLDSEVRDLKEGMGVHICRYAPATSDWYGDVRPVPTRENDYEMDWEAHRTAKFCGIPGFAAQDQAMQESQGMIYDRTDEHLGASDAAIIQLRKRLMDAARDHASSGETPASANGKLYRIRSASAVLGKDEPWVETLSARMRAG
jgi:phthalate 4,5-dioxygenase oxygenase subunit